MSHYYLKGEEVFFYTNTGDAGTPVYAELLNAEEPSIDLSKGQIELKPHASKFVLKRGAKFEAPVSFKYLYAAGADTIRDMIWDSFINGTPIEFAWSHIAISEALAEGFKAWCEVFKFPLMANDEEAVAIEIEAEPTDYVENDVLILPSFIIPSSE